MVHAAEASNGELFQPAPDFFNLFLSHSMTLESQQICFGLNPQLDQQSLSSFLQLAGRQEFADFLSQRLSEEEIHAFVDFFTGILKRNLSEEEYHRLFLQDEHHPHHPAEKG
ncbi:MAG: hypothetical protein KJ900_11660 [Proteobacteria bacterium]|jgi:hypothetical protein|nr:hypothetical protein [Desulfocapsa sp.]MBU4028606.1 hypothetical protein [Pseudomonadota bacterium]MBU4043533.1 hypothetical protein [Pseudomonadota bacterium]